MNNTIKEVLSFIEENDVKFIRLSFCDLFGVHKNISIMADELESAFLEGVSFNPNEINGFLNKTFSNLLLFPDPTTLTVLPWRPGPGTVVRLYCNVKNIDKTPFLGDSRLILKSAEDKLQKLGYSCKLGVECEFYLFKTDTDGTPTKETMDKAGYLDISPLDKGENIRREICLCLEEMALKPETSHHERGPGQNRIDFKFSDPLTSADNLLTFKTVVKSIAERNGLFASFMPKPILDKCGSGLHINMSLFNKGTNIFEDEMSDDAKYFTQGILNKIEEITLFLNPNINSYERLNSEFSHKHIAWSDHNCLQVLRVSTKGNEKSKIILRSTDPTINPYIALGLVLHAGIDGILNKSELTEPINIIDNEIDKKMIENCEILPISLELAIEKAMKSDFLKQIFDENILNQYFKIIKSENDEYNKILDKQSFYDEKYFNIM